MTQLNLSALPAPTVVETLDFETLVAQHKADLLARYPAAENVLHLASEPLVKQIEAFSYREMLLRDRVNQAARANLLAFAAGADLDHKAAFMVCHVCQQKTTAVSVNEFNCASLRWRVMAQPSNISCWPCPPI
jgi:phage-related baseplate assembly protein